MNPETRHAVKRDIRRRAVKKAASRRKPSDHTLPNVIPPLLNQPPTEFTWVEADDQEYEFTPILHCPKHGVQPVTGEFRYHTGTDPGSTTRAACGYIDLDGVF